MSCTPLVMSITLVLATTSTLSLYHIGVVDHYGDPHHPVVHHLGIVDCPKITYHHGVFLVYGVITTLVLRDGLPKKVETAKKEIAPHCHAKFYVDPVREVAGLGSLSSAASTWSTKLETLQVSVRLMPPD